MSTTVNTRSNTAQSDAAARNMLGKKLPVRIGALSGLAGSIAIIVVVTAILLANGIELFAAPQLIASVMLGAGAEGVLAIFLGTVIHLFTGTALGVIFALVMPPIYRVFWIVGGMIYGIGAFLFSALVILPFFTPDVMAAQASVGVLLIAHVVYGFFLGTMGGTYGLFWGPKAEA
jgi:hypothetical protein